MRECPACEGTGVDMDAITGQPPDAQEWVSIYVPCPLCGGVTRVSDEVALAHTLEGP